MKKLLLLFGICVLCYPVVAQNNDTWKLFQGNSVESQEKAVEPRIVLQGNGYQIRTQSVEAPKKKERRTRLRALKVEEEVISHGQLFNSIIGFSKETEVTVFKSDTLSVYSYIRKHDQDSVPTTYTLYVYPLTKRLLAGVAFAKEGQVDTLYQRQLFNEIRSKGIPQSILIRNRTDTIHFPGQNIAIPRMRYMKNQPIPTYYSGLKSFGNNYRKMGGNYNYLSCSWDSFRSDQEAEEKRKNLILNYKKKYETILSESKDTICFRGKEILADRLVGQYRFESNRYKIKTMYIVKAEIEHTLTLIELSFNDSIGREMKLPPFVEENLFRQKNKPQPPIIIEYKIAVGDTIFIAKKNRLPIWTYYDRNTRITGVALGVGEIGGARNVTTNGLKLDVIGSSLTALIIPLGILFPPFFIMDLRSGIGEDGCPVLPKNRYNITNGLSLSVAGSVMENQVINGLDFGGLVTINYRTNGISIGGVSSGSIYNNGLQIGGLWTYAHKSAGLQIGLLGNTGDEVRGVQIGLFNFANKQIRGVQIGAFNMTKKLKGIQIGLWNKNGKRSLPFFNW